MAAPERTGTSEASTSDGHRQPKVVVVDTGGTFGAAGEREILAQAGCRLVTVPSDDDAAVLAEGSGSV